MAKTSSGFNSDHTIQHGLLLSAPSIVLIAGLYRQK